MLRRLFRCAVRLHPSSFRQRFGEEMLYIFDQQKGILAVLGVVLDCLHSLFRQWILRPHLGVKQSVPALQSPAANHMPSFETFDTFPPRKSAIIYGAVLSLILLYVIVSAVPYSGIDFSSQRMPWIAANPTQASSARILLDQYVGEYISKNPPERISIQIEGDAPTDNHLTLSLAAAGHSGLTLTPLSPSKFLLLGIQNSYVNFTADPQGTICCLSLVVNGNAVFAKRQ